MKRVLSGLVVAASLLGVLNGCALKLDYRPQLQAIIHHTEALARSYTYTMARAGQTASVNVIVGDDFRYLATYTEGGQQRAQEIVADDSRALQVSDPSLLAGIKPGAAPAPAAGATSTLAPVSATVPVGGFIGGQQAVSAASLAALQKGEWVEDSSGAYKILRTVRLSRPPTPGADQVGDALRVLSQLDDYLANLPDGAVVPFNPEAGYYFKTLDPFPRPPAGVQRFDVNLSPQLPQRSALQDSPTQRQAAVPGADFFLSAAVYVRNGLVVSLRESVNVGLRLRLPDQDLIARMQDAAIRLPANIGSLPLDRQSAAVDQALNKFYASRLAPALVERYVVVDFTRIGAAPPIALPPAPVQGSLAGIFDRGQLLGGGS